MDQKNALLDQLTNEHLARIKQQIAHEVEYHWMGGLTVARPELPKVKPITTTVTVNADDVQSNSITAEKIKSAMQQWGQALLKPPLPKVWPAPSQSGLGWVDQALDDKPRGVAVHALEDDRLVGWLAPESYQSTNSSILVTLDLDYDASVAKNGVLPSIQGAVSFKKYPEKFTTVVTEEDVRAGGEYLERLLQTPNRVPEDADMNVVEENDDFNWRKNQRRYVWTWPSIKVNDEDLAALFDLDGFHPV